MNDKDRDLYKYFGVPRPRQPANPMLLPVDNPVRARFEREKQERDAMEQDRLVHAANDHMCERQRAKAISITTACISGTLFIGTFAAAIVANLNTINNPAAYHAIYPPVIAEAGLISIIMGSIVAGQHFAWNADKKLNEVAGRHMIDYNKSMDLPAMASRMFDRNVQFLPRQLHGPLRRFGDAIDSAFGLPTNTL